MAERGNRENRLHLIMPSGEALQSVDVDMVRTAFGNNVRIVNQYGPTECSMISTTYTVPAVLPGEIQSIPIGKPVSNVYLYIMDQYQQLVPVGVKGELYIGGIGVGGGYLNHPELTNERFIADPFQPGKRIYRTGDLARYSQDGTLFYLGRLDYQVKIRGYRVELGEIESVARECPGIQDAAVVLWQDQPQELLAAYVTLSDGGGTQIKEILSRHMENRLPFYMLPSSIMVLDEMPLTPNLKINRAALPRPAAGTEVDRYLSPRNDVETKLVSIWEEVLGVERVGVRDNFFELGGHSLLAMRLLARIQQEFGHSLPVLLLFKEGTVEALAESLADALKNLQVH